MKISRGTRWLIFLGATVVLGGFVLGENAYRNAFMHGLVDVLDIKDGSCQKATVSVGSACPAGCRAKPVLGPEEVGRAPECRSIFWVATCGTECDAREGLIRTEDGRFMESGTLIIRLAEPPEVYRDEFSAMGVDLESAISGLWRYRAHFANPEDTLREMERMEQRIGSLSYVVSIDRVER